VVKNDFSQEAYTGEGSLINSGKFNGFDSKEAIQRLTKYIEKHHLGSQKTTWHLRDWIISRQRFWGPPIPMIYCQKCAKQGKSWFATEEAREDRKIPAMK
jgi:leucyl-tRNA synthetase